MWIGSNSGSSPFAGDSYSQWKFYDGSDLSQCHDKDCDSGEGKSSKSWLDWRENDFLSW